MTSTEHVAIAARFLARHFKWLVVVGVGGFAFYWYEYRPQQIRAACWRGALESVERENHKKAGDHTADFQMAYVNSYYRSCMRAEGLEPPPSDSKD